MKNFRRWRLMSTGTCIAIALAMQILDVSPARGDSAMKSGTQSATTGSLTAIYDLNQSEREALVAAANKALQKYTRDPRRDTGTLIPRHFWGEEIERLAPLRVRNHFLNVFIVLAEDEATEEGLYVSIPISSYALQLQDEGVLLLEALTQPSDRSFGRLHRCKLRKSEFIVKPQN